MPMDHDLYKEFGYASERWLLMEIIHELRAIRRELAHPSTHITHFHIQETTMLAIAPGNSPVFTATPVPSTSVPSTPPTWTSSDTTNAPASVDPTGLIATVAIPTSAVAGTSFTLTVSYTNADGTVATGSTSQTIVAPASPDITSFTVDQTT